MHVLYQVDIHTFSHAINLYILYTNYKLQTSMCTVSDHGTSGYIYMCMFLMHVTRSSKSGLNSLSKFSGLTNHNSSCFQPITFIHQTIVLCLGIWD